jgi:hypothetical protein
MLSEANRIDFVAESPQGEIVLAISAHLDWKQHPKTVKQLDKKLQNYVRYIEGGQYSEQYGNAPVFIQIMTAYPLSPQAEKLVQKVQNATGIDIKVEVMGPYGALR